MGHRGNIYSPQFRPPGSIQRYPASKPVKPVSFICLAPAAQSVSVIGDFNGWKLAAHPMKRHADGSWHALVPVAEFCGFEGCQRNGGPTNLCVVQSPSS